MNRRGNLGASHTQGMNRENPTGIHTGEYGIVTKSELGLQGTQMADLYTGEPVCLHGRVKGI